MRRGFVAVVITSTILLLVAGPSGAITNGSPDGAQHPNVGGLVAPVAYSDGTWITCSGTLISSTVFLTAAHCGSDGQQARVTFSTAYHDGDQVYGGVFRADPNYQKAQGDPHDIAVVVLDQAVPGINPARLPGEGTLSNLPAKQTFTSVGYGAYAVQKSRGGHSFLYNDVRMAATGTLNATNPSWLRLSMNPSTGNGGTCYGDSGGPNFLGSTDVIAGITNKGDVVCRSTNVDYRLDTTSAREFLAGFVALP
jgi:secreted trypsin-like serine protease